MRKPNKDDSSLPSTTGEIPALFTEVVADRLFGLLGRPAVSTDLTLANAMSSHFGSQLSVQ
jgi:hypothetical protein